MRKEQLALICWATCCVLLGEAKLLAEDPQPAVSREQLLPAIERSVVLLQRAARNYPMNRECFACHHQTLPLLAMTRAQDAGVTIDQELATSTQQFATDSFQSKLTQLQAGEGIGGRGLTVGYGLWTFRIAACKPDDLTAAMVEFLLKTQESDGHWGLHAVRPPAEESLLMCTVLAAAGIQEFASKSQQPAASVAVERARDWLAKAKLEYHEDRVARLWGLVRLAGNPEEIARAEEALVATQQPDGGWRQMSDLETDAYATGTALYVLLESAALRTPSRDSVELMGEQAAPESAQAKRNRAAAWLLGHQLADGSWHVQTRARPVQMFFDNGDPHGKDQFISTAATGWACAALARLAGPDGNAPTEQDSSH